MTYTADMITRREALRRAAYVLGGALAAPTVAGVLAGCEAAPREAANGAATADAWVPRTLSAEQDEMVLTMGEYILPETDTPGARAARVNEYIDAMLTDFYPADRREQFLAGLDRADMYAQSRYGTRFIETAPEQQLELVEALNRAAFPPRNGNRDEPPDREVLMQEGEGREIAGNQADRSLGDGGEDEWDPDDMGRGSFFDTLKGLVLVGYYTSEIGGTEELAANPMGPWRADIPYAEVGQTWSY